MDVKFNSLFDNKVSQNETRYYLTKTQDKTLLLNKLILSEDLLKTKGVETIEARNFGDYPNYILSGRPCATRGCPPDKFCDSSGWPESPVFQQENPCINPLAPNSSRGDPNRYARNIDIEAKLFNIDFIEGKCHLKKPKSNPCEQNPETCPLNCHKKIVKTDYELPTSSQDKWDFNAQPVKNINNLSERKKIIQAKAKQRCEGAVEEIKKAQQFNFFQPTKRRDIIKW